jgi:hypothetical protein
LAVYFSSSESDFQPVIATKSRDIKYLAMQRSRTNDRNPNIPRNSHRLRHPPSPSLPSQASPPLTPTLQTSWNQLSFPGDKTPPRLSTFPSTPSESPNATISLFHPSHPTNPFNACRGKLVSCTTSLPEKPRAEAPGGSHAIGHLAQISETSLNGGY